MSFDHKPHQSAPHGMKSKMKKHANKSIRQDIRIMTRQILEDLDKNDETIFPSGKDNILRY